MWRVQSALALVLAGGLVAAPVVAAETLTIEASRDGTLIEHPDGARANGSGIDLRAGRTNQMHDSIRRGVLYFDVAGALPRGARVEGARLTLHMEPSNTAPAVYSLHRLLADWGEGASIAGGGSGAPAEPRDATWLHSFHDGLFWTRPGGQFARVASAETEVGASGAYVWEGEALLRDVRGFKAAPRRNFGWVLIGDESTAQSVKIFAAREHPDPARRPTLEITYSAPDLPPPGGERLGRR